MQVRQVVEAGAVRFTLHPREDEAGLLGRDRCTVWVGAGWDPDTLHPDLLALALVLLLRPATRGPLRLPHAVSRAFAEVVSRKAGLDLEPVDDQLAPRTPPADGVPGLCFSGGVDSVAALTVLPDYTRSYFLERRVPPGAPERLLRPDAGRSAAEAVGALGRSIRVIPSDLEYLRDPPGFPEHLANAVPALLYADQDRLAAIAWGTVLESAYRIGRGRFHGYLDRGYNRRWHALFQAAGLPMGNPVMGVSEVGTASLAAASPFAHLAQSCVAGPLGAPCGACVKCFRKTVLTAAVGGAWPSDEELAQVLRAYPVRSYLATVPLRQPAGLLWSLERYPGRDPVLLAVRDRLERAGQDVSFVPRWYRESQQHWPEAAWIGQVADTLDQQLGPMTPNDVDALHRFDLAGAEQSPAAAAYADAIAYLADRRANLNHGVGVKPASQLVPDGVPRAERDALHAQLVASQQRELELRSSTSYRLGHAMVRPLGRMTGRLRGA